MADNFVLYEHDFVFRRSFKEGDRELHNGRIKDAGTNNLRGHYTVPELYQRLLPVTIITSFSLHAIELVAFTLKEVTQHNLHARMIIVCDMLQLQYQQTNKEFKDAIFFCLDEPTRIMKSICLVGITMAKYCKNPKWV